MSQEQSEDSAAAQDRDAWQALHATTKAERDAARYDLEDARAAHAETRKELDEGRQVARSAAQRLIEEIGATGPENLSDTVERAVRIIRDLREELASATASNAALVDAVANASPKLLTTDCDEQIQPAIERLRSAAREHGHAGAALLDRLRAAEARPAARDDAGITRGKRT